MNEEEQKYVSDLEQAYEAKNLETTQQQIQLGQASIFGSEIDENLIKWQLDLREELERIDHMLRGHQLKFDDKGNLVYTDPTDSDLIPFNEHGVQMLLNVISFYLNRNTILSNYDEETINWKVYDIGNEITDLIFMKYEQMGMDTDQKIKLYPMITQELTNTIHSAYLRALHGGERESLRTARHVTQNQPVNSQMGYQQQPNQQRSTFKVWKPTTWFKA